MNKDEEMRNILQETWPDWEIVKELGRGSYGIVYQITRRDKIGTDAAAKVISIPQDASEVQELQSEGQTIEETRTYFKEVTDDCVRELTLMYSLKDQANIVQVEDHKVIPKEDGVGWYILIREELLTSLKDYMSMHTMTEEDVIKLGINICSALEACSKENIIHRDIKPENLFISNNGVFKLGDFGIARKLENMAVSMSMKGTSNYMAPEVMKSPNYDATVDIYSLGLVMYRLMNKNKMPFIDMDKRVVSAAEREEATRRRIDGEALPAPCAASDGLSAIILKACAYDPAQRFQSAAEMKRALVNPKKFLESAQAASTTQTSAVDTEPPDQTEVVHNAPVNHQGSSSETPPPKKKRHVLPIVIAVIVVVLAIVAVVIFAIPHEPDPPVPTEPSESFSSESENPSESGTAEPSASAYSEKVSDALETAEKYADDDDYKNAIITIQDAQEKNINEENQDSQESKDLQEKYEEYKEAYENQVLQKADGQAADGDYLAAYNTINDAIEFIGEDDELSDKLKEYKNEYIQDTVNQAESLNDQKDYNGARSKVETALKEFPDNETLQAELDKLPAELMDFFYDGNYSRTEDHAVMAGVDYGEYYRGGGSFGSFKALFNLGGKYNLLTFTAGHLDGQGFSNASITFYLDGEESQKIELTGEMMPQEFTVDLNGVTQLIIEGSSNMSDYALVDMYVFP